ncbi:hypothetical protein FCM35_KLT15688 [Carex littledalei]|uniref:Transmembrane protein n=1 Tax=Carex littledalei TaxID=544730 RepID=A0A833REY0_9POAL|nr:hypothetical protein FCM35_KLT15688 [Carex littledalei]
MAMKALPMLCIVFLLVSASLVFPSVEGIRTLEESKAGVTNNPLNPGSVPAVPRGQPYTPGCHKIYCPPSPP